MDTEKVVNDVEKTLKRICKDIKKKKGAVGSDKINSLSKLVNAYNRLLDTANKGKTPSEDGDPNYYDSLSS